MLEISEKIAGILATLPQLPGVYRMLDEQGELLYVGKARVLKNRVSSYFQKTIVHPRTKALVARIRDIVWTITTSETEALLLEQTLIKTLQPPFNVSLRDDRSYPYIFLSADKDYPSIGWSRGRQTGAGRYFGPYPNSQAARDSLMLLQRMFMVRQCDDATFRNRDRPCLQYQIKRCRGPCVGLVTPADYAEDVQNTVRFLEGQSTQVQERLVERMEQAAGTWQYEAAALYRDQLSALRQVQEQQAVYCERGEADVFALDQAQGLSCVQVLWVRGGRVLGSNSYFPETTENEPAAILAEFIAGFYCQQTRDLPDEIIAELDEGDDELLAAAIRSQYGRKLSVRRRVREERAAWLELAKLNAREVLKAKLASHLHAARRLQALREALALDVLPQRMECFDISHARGEATVASCVVFDAQGPKKRDYRHYLIKDITPGDDYAAMEQALRRRFGKAGAEATFPDVLFIDGGRGQLAQAVRVLAELQVRLPCLCGVAKGEGRKPGLETLHFPDGRTQQLPTDHPALHLIQHIRDEAHRFAITKHRARRDKARRQSPLEAIPGLGPKRRRDLLNHFGGLQDVLRASINELANVPGIGPGLAETIYAALH